jgi:threonylcarbamoyladenosine tRNA methylthiotransferase CDKAL1
VAEVVARARQVLLEGVVEIWLTSEDTGTYGRDIGSSLPELLWALVGVMQPGTMLRVGMTNPPYILEHLEAMVDIFKHPRVYAFLHVPVQV